jgi:hypothetical protein
MKRRSPRNQRPSSRGLTLGPQWGEKINAVEGIKLTPAAERRAADFERRGLSPAERRKEILRAYRQD